MSNEETKDEDLPCFEKGAELWRKKTTKKLQKYLRKS